MKKMLIQLWRALLSRLSGRFSKSVIWNKFIEVVWRKFGVHRANGPVAVEKHQPTPRTNARRAIEQCLPAPENVTPEPDVQQPDEKWRNRQTLWGGCTDANPKLLLNDT